MAFDAFIKFDGIAGESLDEQHKDWIEIAAYNFGVQQSTSATASSSGGATSGRTALTKFVFTKSLDRSSCKLMESSCAGTHFKNVVVALHRAGGEKLKYFKITLEEVIISDYSHSAHEGVPTEVIQLDYGRIKTAYTLQSRADGSGAGNVAGGWDRIANKIYS